MMIISAYVFRIRQVPGPPTGLKKVVGLPGAWNPNGAPCFAWKLKGLGGWRVQPTSKIEGPLSQVPGFVISFFVLSFSKVQVLQKNTVVSPLMAKTPLPSSVAFSFPGL